MTVNVIKGLIGENKSGLSTAATRPQTQNAATTANIAARTASAAASLGAIGGSEASLATVRVARSTGLSEKIRDPKEAQKLADDVSERIRGEGEGEGAQAHSNLVYSSARDHFA